MTDTTHDPFADATAADPEDEDAQLLEDEEGLRERVDLPLGETFDEDTDEDDDAGEPPPEA